MAFESLGEKLQQTFKKLKGKGKVSEKDLKEAMREVKMALLEADVNFKVVKNFERTVFEKSLGSEVMESLTPGQQVIKIVRDELTELMGGAAEKLAVSPKPPTVILMAGLQGAGKTTTCAKLAKLLKKQGKKPMLVACDVYRPAAIKQLEIVGSQAEVPVFSRPDSQDAVAIAKEAVETCDVTLCDTVIIDTAGRLHINEELMGELVSIKEATSPDEILLVLDSMTGQDAVNVAQSFNEQLEISGVILTKLDSDARGGAALSVRAVTGKPIKFAAVGEKLDDLETFHPDRMASRILGFGDVLTLIDKAQETLDEKKALELEQKLRQSKFDLNDFLDQMQQMKKMGPLEDILGMMPGINKKALSGAELDTRQMDRTEAIILSMTKKERENPSIINSSRRKRIAQGSGTTVQDVNALLSNFDRMQKMFKQMTGGNMKKKMRKLKGMPGMNFPF